MEYRDIEILARTHEAVSRLRVLKDNGEVDWEAKPEFTLDLDESSVVWYEVDLPLKAGEQFKTLEDAKQAIDEYYEEDSDE